MNVIMPNTYEVNFTEKERESISNCLHVLRVTLETMRNHNCNVLEWGCAGAQVNDKTLESNIEDLEILLEVDTMFQGESPRPFGPAHRADA